MPFGRGALAAGQKGETVAEPALDLVHREGAGARGGELDRQRQAVEAVAEPGDDVEGQHGAGPGGAGAFDEEGDGRAVLAGVRGRRAVPPSELRSESSGYTCSAPMVSGARLVASTRTVVVESRMSCT